MSSSARTTQVTCTFRFEAAHHLPHHPGKCHALHGHGYRIEVTVEGDLRPDGMVLDFDEIEEVVEREVISRWDHQLLNDLVDNPTAEILAWEAFDRLSAAGLAVRSLTLWETADSRVEVGR